LCPRTSEWWKAINEKIRANAEASAKLTSDITVPMNYYAPLKIIDDALQKQPSDFILVSEGSNTMDIGRTLLSNDHAKQRLDAGTFGTMGVGLGFAIAAQSLHPDKKVVMVMGDSAFGFSGMEVETACRYGLPLKIIIINNSGITRGMEESPDNKNEIPVTGLTPKARYEKMAEAFGGKGACVSTHQELKDKLEEMLADRANLWILNVLIDPYAGRKEQEFSWLIREDSLSASKKKEPEAKL
jgi:2-hydroxyacyl-CoA lyase 1